MKRSGIGGPLVAPNAYIAALLPEETLTEDLAAWRAPTSAEIRIVIGRHSETGLSGAEAANLVGVQPQNFRKYTSADGAASRQKMSFSMWHMLLHRTGVKLLPVSEIRPRA